MKFLLTLTCLFIAVCAFAASGDKPAQMRVPGGTPANSTAASKAAGELNYNSSYLYINISSAARPHWRRIAVGNGF